MKITFVGRKKEQKILQDALSSPEAEMISVIGRRRVGKTFLIKSVYKEVLDFELSGIQNSTTDHQLTQFSFQIQEYFEPKIPIGTPNTWLDAFRLLINCLKIKKVNRKHVIFLDEVPWLSTHKSGFLQGLSYFWNSWAVNQPIVVVICGSAASWMIKKVLRHKGGLYNRVTKKIHLRPFNLSEMETYLESRNIYFDHYQLLQIYMAMGGIPHYLKEIQRGKSAVQNIDDICFSQDGLLHDEFQGLYPALFDHADNHIAIIRALANKHQGLTRNELLQASGLSNGGRITTVLDELVQSGFISTYYNFGKKKRDRHYRLTDEYSLFYLKFIENNIREGAGTWNALSQTASYKSWSGYAFENICLKHTYQIKKALSVLGVYSVTTAFSKQGTKAEKGTQIVPIAIGIVMDRNDHVINIFEIKFYNTEYSITKDYAKKLRDKIRIFQEATKTKKQIFLTMITTFGLKENKHSLGLVHNDLTMEMLFESMR